MLEKWTQSMALTRQKVKTLPPPSLQAIEPVLDHCARSIGKEHCDVHPLGAEFPTLLQEEHVFIVTPCCIAEAMAKVICPSLFALSGVASAEMQRNETPVRMPVPGDQRLKG
jgi:hypothetical protein